MIIATATKAESTSALNDELARLAHIAAMVLNEHINADGLCVACGDVPFPCRPAVLAEHNTALLP